MWAWSTWMDGKWKHTHALGQFNIDTPTGMFFFCQMGEDQTSCPTPERHKDKTLELWGSSASICTTMSLKLQPKPSAELLTHLLSCFNSFWLAAFHEVIIQWSFLASCWIRNLLIAPPAPGDSEIISPGGKMVSNRCTILALKGIYISKKKKKSESVSSVHLLEFLVMIVIRGLLVVRSLAVVGWWFWDEEKCASEQN